MKKKFVVAIIPARLGSKGLKNKNIRKLNGKELIYYAIKDAQKSKFVDQVVVSTDSLKIKKIAEKYGASVPFLRSKKLSGDNVPSNPVLKDAVINLEKIYKKKIDIIVYLQATEIFREPWMIDKCIKKIYKTKSYDCAFMAYKNHKNYWVKGNNGRSNRILKKKYDSVRQKKSPIYREDTGLACATKRKNILKGQRIGGKIAIIPHEYDLSSIDIHNSKQFKLAEKINKFCK